MGKSKKYILSKIDIRLDHVHGFQNPQNMIYINEITLIDYLNQNTDSDSFNLLVPPIGLYDASDQQKVFELLDYTNIVIPILVCSDDMDFSCTVVSTSVVEEKDCIVWKSFGYYLDMSKPIHVPPLAFEKDNYKKFVENFKGLIASGMIE
ncbi:MAG: hypothetical protein ACQEXX_22165 [Bacillota bacterium]